MSALTAWYNRNRTLTGILATLTVVFAINALVYAFSGPRFDPFEDAGRSLQEMQRREGPYSPPPPLPGPLGGGMDFWIAALGQIPNCSERAWGQANCGADRVVLLCRNEKDLRAQTATIRFRILGEGAPVPPLPLTPVINADAADPAQLVALLAATCS